MLLVLALEMVLLKSKNNIKVPSFNYLSEGCIKPKDFFKTNLPQRCVLCFFSDVINSLLKNGEIYEISCLHSELGKNPIYKIAYKDYEIVVVQPGVGAPFAAIVMEKMIAMGCTKFILCGGVGVFDESIPLGKIIVPYGAIRNEGLSEHYLPRESYIQTNPQSLNRLMEVLEGDNVDYITTITWTTDGFFRETKMQMKSCMEQGCLCVELEYSALCAVAQYRNVEIAAIFYASDNFKVNEWKTRDYNLHYSYRHQVFDLALKSIIY